MHVNIIMWCDLGKPAWNRPCDIYVTFSVFYLMKVLSWRGTFFWTPWIGPVVPKLWAILKDSQNNRKQKKCISFFGYISQSTWSMLPISRLIPLVSQHILCTLLERFLKCQRQLLVNCTQTSAFVNVNEAKLHFLSTHSIKTMDWHEIMSWRWCHRSESRKWYL